MRFGTGQEPAIFLVCVSHEDLRVIGRDENVWLDMTKPRSFRGLYKTTAVANAKFHGFRESRSNTLLCMKGRRPLARVREGRRQSLADKGGR